MRYAPAWIGKIDDETWRAIFNNAYETLSKEDQRVVDIAAIVLSTPMIHMGPMGGREIIARIGMLAAAQDGVRDELRQLSTDGEPPPTMEEIIEMARRKAERQEKRKRKK